MNYKKIYNQIIENRKQNKFEGYTENHHIIPRSLGGSNKSDNLVSLSAREHFLCHFLLAKMYPKETFNWYKMNHAFMIMRCDSLIRNKRYFNSRLYEALKKNFSSVMSFSQKGEKNSQYGTKWQWISDLKLKKNKKIRKDKKIPKDCLPGLNKWIIKENKCKKCGQIQCLHPDICRNSQRLKCFIKYLNFDTSVLGNLTFYDEYNRIILLLNTEYNINKLSIEDIKNKYRFSSNEMVRMMFKSLGLERRTLSQSVSLYISKNK